MQIPSQLIFKFTLECMNLKLEYGKKKTYELDLISSMYKINLNLYLSYYYFGFKLFLQNISEPITSPWLRSKVGFATFKLAKQAWHAATFAYPNGLTAAHSFMPKIKTALVQLAAIFRSLPVSMQANVINFACRRPRCGPAPSPSRLRCNCGA